MPAEFDAIKAIREEIMGLNEVRGAIIKREHALQIAYGEVEIELNAVTQLRGFADAEIARKRMVLQQLHEKEGS